MVSRFISVVYAINTSNKIVWLRGVRDTLEALGLKKLWENPKVASFPSKMALKARYCERVTHKVWGVTEPTSMAGAYLEIKPIPRILGFSYHPWGKKIVVSAKSGLAPIENLYCQVVSFK